MAPGKRDDDDARERPGRRRRWRILARPQRPRPGRYQEFLMPNLRVSVVRERSLRTRQHPRIESSADLSAVLAPCIPEDADREHFVMALLDVHHRLIGVHTVGIGHQNGILIHPREIFRIAVLAGAAYLGFGHNHPSGQAFVSEPDESLTQRLCMCGLLIGIEVVDHVIFGEGMSWLSMKKEGKLPNLTRVEPPRPTHLDCEKLASKLQKDRSAARRRRAAQRRTTRERAVEPVRPPGGRA